MNKNTDAPIQLYFIRHGNTFGPEDKVVQVGLKSDLPLTEKGLEQAKQLGQYFNTKKIIPNAIYSGQLLRQQQTATQIQNQLSHSNNIPILQENALQEIDYGAWEGLTTNEIKAKWEQEHHQWENAAAWPQNIFHGTFEGKIIAIKAFIATLEYKHPPGTKIFAISSNGVIRCLLSLIEDLWLEITKEQKFQEYKIKTGNFCKIELQQGQLTLKRWNQSPTFSHKA